MSTISRHYTPTEAVVCRTSSRSPDELLIFHILAQATFETAEAGFLSVAFCLVLLFVQSRQRRVHSLALVVGVEGMLLANASAGEITNRQWRRTALRPGIQLVNIVSPAGAPFFLRGILACVVWSSLKNGEPRDPRPPVPLKRACVMLPVCWAMWVRHLSMARGRILHNFGQDIKTIDQSTKMM